MAMVCKRGLPLLLCALLAGCAQSPAAITDVAPTALPAAAATPTPAAQAAGYTLAERTVYYPEESDAASADYVLSYAYPVFSGTPQAAAMNEAVALWEHELGERVSTERLPYADRAEGEALPETRVAAEVWQSQGYTNILFTETAAYGAEAEQAQTALVLDAQGEETNLYEITGLYTPEALLAQQIYNRIDAEDPQRQRYYGDLGLADIEQALDLYNGFTLREDGAGYTLLFSAGVLADESQGLQALFVERTSLYPDFVGELIPLEAYERLLPALHQLARACGAEYHSFEHTPDALSYTLFMAQQFAGRTAENGLIRVPQAEYEALGKAYFAALPAELANGDGTVLVEGEYRIPSLFLADYGLRVDDCREQDGALSLICTLYSGAPGSADRGELAPVNVQLLADAAANCGYLFTGFSFV